MAWLLFVLVGLLVWVGRLTWRVSELEARETDASAMLSQLESRVGELPRAARAQATAERVTATPARSAAEPSGRPSRPGGASVAPLVQPIDSRFAADNRPASHRASPGGGADATPDAGPCTGAAASSRTPGRAGSLAARGAETADRAAAAEPKPGFDWEELIGVRLFSWAAGIALAVAAIFFLRSSIQHGWLQPPVQLAIGLVVGVGLLVGCELKAARRYAVTANALDGSAIVILFSTFFATYRPWHLIENPAVVFAPLALVTVVAVLLSIRRDSVFIALLGLVGGFSTPALLSTGQDNPFGLFGYLLLLNAGLGWVAYRKRWPLLVGLSLLFTTLYQWSWVATFLAPGKLPAATAIFLAFPILGFVSLGLAGRTGALDAGAEATGGPGSRRRPA